MSIYSEIAAAEAENRDFAVITVVSTSGSTARSAGAIMLMYPDGSISGSVGGGIVEHMVKIDAKKCIQSGEPLLKDYEIPAGGPKSDVHGGTVKCFIQPRKAANRLYLFGAGHVNQELTPLAKAAGFHVTVIDPRESLINTEKIKKADRVILDDYSVIDSMIFEPSSYFVIGTFDHSIDGELLGKAVKTEAKYIGMLGGKPKIRAIIKKLIDEGFSKEMLRDVHSPAGLDIGGQSPFQIALSISAELLAVSEGREGGFCSRGIMDDILSSI